MTSRRLLILAWVLLLLTALLPARLTRYLWSAPQHALQVALSPFSDPLSRLAQRLRPGRVVQLDLGPDDQLRENYAQLLAYARQLEQQLQHAGREIDYLRQIRQQRSLSGVNLITAQVTSGPLNRAAPALAINRGRREGVEVGFVVADGLSLVGRIADAGALTSSVELVAAPGMQLVVRVVPPTPGASPRQAIVAVEWSPKLQAFTAKVGADQPLVVGDLAHLADDRWPNEALALVVGKVTSLENWPDHPLLYRQLVISPIRLPEHLARVVVLAPSSAQQEGAGP